MGPLFDLYRVARWALRPGRLFTVICDVIFWLFAATVVFMFLLASFLGRGKVFHACRICSGF